VLAEQAREVQVQAVAGAQDIQGRLLLERLEGPLLLEFLL
jgi:hypothetical protein